MAYPQTRLAADMERAYYERDSELLRRLMARADTVAAVLAPLLNVDATWLTAAINTHFAGRHVTEKGRPSPKTHTTETV